MNRIYPHDYTYIQGDGKSVIDYIIQSDDQIVRNVQVLQDTCDNTSPHNPVSTEMVYIPPTEILPPENPPKAKRINWNKLDHQKYSSLVSERINVLITDEDKDIHLKLQKVTDTVIKSASECAPYKKHFGVES